MKAKNNELDVDFIGGAKSLTKEEEKKISGFIKSSTAKQRLANRKRTKKARLQK